MSSQFYYTSSETWRIRPTKQTVKIQTFLYSYIRGIVCEMVRQSKQQHSVDHDKSTASRNRNKKKKMTLDWSHCEKPSIRITRQVLTWNPQGKRKRGRPRNTWRRDMESEVKKMGYTWKEIVTMAQRRIQWRFFIDAPSD